MPSIDVIYGCPACRDFNVFGIDDEGCCYLYMDYCRNRPECKMKELISFCLKKETSKEDILKRLKEVLSYKIKK